MTGADWFVVVACIVLAVARPMQLFRGSSRRIKGRVERPWLQPLQLGTFWALIVLSSAEYFLLQRSLMWPLIVPALAVIVSTKALKEWAISALGPYWSPHVELRRNQPVIDSGPYAFMRHPSYLNGIAEGLCVPLLSASWFTLAVAVVLILFVFRVRIRTEEEAMTKVIGDAYVRYCHRVSRFKVLPLCAKTDETPARSEINEPDSGRSAAKTLKPLSAILGYRFFGLLVLVVTAISLCLLAYWLREIYQYRLFPLPPGPVIGHSGPHQIQLHKVLSDGISIVGVAASILIAALAIAAPLYLTLWQSMSDSLVDLYKKIDLELLKENKKENTDPNYMKQLLEDQRELTRVLKEFRQRVGPARDKLRWTLIACAFLLVGIMLIIAVPFEGVTYVGFTVVTCLAVAVGLMFIHMIFEITDVEPVKWKIEIQLRLLKIPEE